MVRCIKVAKTASGSASWVDERARACEAMVMDSNPA